MADAFEKVRDQALVAKSKGHKDQSKCLRSLDAKQRKALTLFQDAQEIGAKDLASLFGYAPRTASPLCQKWVAAGFLKTASKSRKTRSYKLSQRYASIIHEEG